MKFGNRFLFLLLLGIYTAHVLSAPIPEEIIEYEDELEEASEVSTLKSILMKKSSSSSNVGHGHHTSSAAESSQHGAHGAHGAGTATQTNDKINDIIVFTPHPKGPTTTEFPHVHPKPEVTFHITVLTTPPPSESTTVMTTTEDPEVAEVNRMMGLMAGVVSSSDDDAAGVPGPTGGAAVPIPAVPIPAVPVPPVPVPTVPVPPVPVPTVPVPPVPVPTGGNGIESEGEVDEDDPVAMLQKMMKENGPLAMIGGGLALVLASSVGFSTKIISMLKNPAQIGNVSDQFKKMMKDGKGPGGAGLPVDKLKDKLKMFTDGKGGKGDIAGKLKGFLDKGQDKDKGKNKDNEDKRDRERDKDDQNGSEERPGIRDREMNDRNRAEQQAGRRDRNQDNINNSGERDGRRDRDDRDTSEEPAGRRNKDDLGDRGGKRDRDDRNGSGDRGGKRDRDDRDGSGEPEVRRDVHKKGQSYQGERNDRGNGGPKSRQDRKNSLTHKVSIEDDPSDRSSDFDPYNNGSTESSYPEVHKMGVARGLPSREKSRNVGKGGNSARDNRATSELVTTPMIHNQEGGRGKPEMKRIESLVNSRAQLNNIDNLVQKEKELKKLESIVQNPAQLERLESLVKNPAQLQSVRDLLQREDELRQVQAMAEVNDPRISQFGPLDPRDKNYWQGTAQHGVIVPHFENPQLQAAMPGAFPGVVGLSRQHYPSDFNMEPGGMHTGSGHAQNPSQQQPLVNDMRRGSTIPGYGNPYLNDPFYSQRASRAPSPSMQYGGDPQRLQGGSAYPMSPLVQLGNEYPPIPTHWAPTRNEMRRPESMEYGQGSRPQLAMSPRPLASGQRPPQVGNARNFDPAYSKMAPAPTASMQFGDDPQLGRGATLPTTLPAFPFTNEVPSGRAPPNVSNLTSSDNDMRGRVPTPYGTGSQPAFPMSPRSTTSGQLATPFGNVGTYDGLQLPRENTVPMSPPIQLNVKVPLPHLSPESTNFRPESQLQHLTSPRSTTNGYMPQQYGKQENYDNGTGGLDDPRLHISPRGRDLSPFASSLVPQGNEGHMRSTLPIQQGAMQHQYGQASQPQPEGSSRPPHVSNAPTPSQALFEEPFDKDEAFASLDRILESLEQKEPYEAFDDIRKIQPNPGKGLEESGNMTTVAKKLAKYPAGVPVPGQDPPPTRFPYKPPKGQGGHQILQNGFNDSRLSSGSAVPEVKPRASSSSNNFLAPPPIRLSPVPKVVVTSPPPVGPMGGEGGPNVIPRTGAVHRYQGPTEDEYYDGYLQTGNHGQHTNGLGNHYGQIGSRMNSDYHREYNRNPML